MDEAEKLLIEAHALVPDSKNINYRLGRFYYDNGAKEKGLAMLDKVGLLAHVTKLPTRPLIDGKLDDAAWKETVPLTQFYQAIWKAGAYPIKGRSEVYLGYLDGRFYIGVKGYETSTANLVANATDHDARRISRDDCVEIFIDADHDYRTYAHVIVNSIGAYHDKYIDRGIAGYGDRELLWEGVSAAAAAVADTFWSAEVELPIADLPDIGTTPNKIWGFNVARVRIGNAGEYGQWTPTYGDAHSPQRFGFLVFD